MQRTINFLSFVLLIFIVMSCQSGQSAEADQADVDVRAIGRALWPARPGCALPPHLAARPRSVLRSVERGPAERTEPGRAACSR